MIESMIGIAAAIGIVVVVACIVWGLEKLRA